LDQGEWGPPGTGFQTAAPEGEPGSIKGCLIAISKHWRLMGPGKTGEKPRLDTQRCGV